MSPNTTSNDIDSVNPLNEWVEIVEPKTRKIIYANLHSGICANHPPEGAYVSRTKDFSDYWWELYDKKTGKNYYFNPDQQKTVWTKPKETITTNGNGNLKRTLIIPVSRLQTIKKPSPADLNLEKRDASTQTIASNLVSIGTQTINESVLEDEFNDKLRLVDLSKDLTKSNSCTHSNDSSKSQMNQRQMSDLDSRDRAQYPKNRQNQNDNSQRKYRPEEFLTSKNEESSHSNAVSNQLNDNGGAGDYISYFGPPSSYRKNRIFTSKQHAPSKSIHHPNDEYLSSTSTFVNHPNSSSISDKKPKQQLITNNLSHYLVREARAMGIALISDDEIDDDEHESDEDCVIDDDDEETDMRDASNHRLDLKDDSSEGWKSFSDPDSPNRLTAKSTHPTIQKSPIHCKTSTSFTFNELLDDEKNPASCKSQQLDHRKLVENFKKSRQTSSFGMHDSLGRPYKLNANQAVQKIRTVADSYFNTDKDSPSDRHLRQLSALTTLPRPNKVGKDKVALSRPDGETSGIIDADYDVVEENCGYYSDSEQIQPPSARSISEKSNRNLANLNHSGQPPSPSSHFDRNKSSRGSTFSVESFARENLTRHPKKGGLLFNRKVKWDRMISWTKSSIKQPMISSVSSDLNSDAIASFKLIQQFMGDRKVTMTKKYRQILAQSGLSSDDLKDSSTKSKNLGRNNSTNASHNQSSSSTSSFVASIPDRLRDELAYELVVKGCSKSALRDEIYVQVARQLTENSSQDSISWGLILISILLSYFSPSSKFSPFLLSFLETHSHQMARDVCLPRLDKRLRQNWLTYCRKPADGKEISIVRLSITKWPQYCGVFGESLERIMTLQSCSSYLKTLRLPWILTTLGQKLIETGGHETEGIFRCAADHDLIAQLRLEIDCVDFRKITDAKQVHSLLSNVQDPHVIAGLLKLFFRQLYEPVFPVHLYESCLSNGQDGHGSCRLFNEHLPNLNKDVVAYLIRLLQFLAKSDNVLNTKMDNSNLSMVWAPNLLRVPHSDTIAPEGSKSGSKLNMASGSSEEQQHSSTSLAPSQSVIFEQTRQEMQFIQSLITHLDTSFIENVI